MKENTWFAQLYIERPTSTKITRSDTQTDINMNRWKIDIKWCFEFDSEKQTLSYTGQDDSYVMFMWDASISVDIEWNTKVVMMLLHNDEVIAKTPVTFCHKYHSKTFSANKTMQVKKWDTLKIKIQASLWDLNTIIEWLNIQVITLNHLNW